MSSEPQVRTIGRPKRLYRVVATDRKGNVIVRRVYQSRKAALARCDRLRVVFDSSRITIEESDVVTWPPEDRGRP